MSDFSMIALDAIESFARSAGLQVKPAPDGTFSFEFARSGLLSFTSVGVGDRVVISLARMPQGLGRRQELALFKQAGFDPTFDSFLYAGLSEDGYLVASVSIASKSLDLRVIDESLQRLAGALDRAGI